MARFRPQALVVSCRIETPVVTSICHYGDVGNLHFARILLELLCYLVHCRSGYDLANVVRGD